MISIDFSVAQSRMIAVFFQRPSGGGRGKDGEGGARLAAMAKWGKWRIVCL